MEIWAKEESFPLLVMNQVSYLTVTWTERMKRQMITTSEQNLFPSYGKHIPFEESAENCLPSIALL
jgi:hypothetical protein